MPYVHKTSSPANRRKTTINMRKFAGLKMENFVSEATKQFLENDAPNSIGFLQLDIQLYGVQAEII